MKSGKKASLVVGPEIKAVALEIKESMPDLVNGAEALDA